MELTNDDINNILVIMGASQIKVADAQVVVTLQNKLQALLKPDTVEESKENKK